MGYLKFIIILIRTILFYIFATIFMLFILAPIGNLLALFVSSKGISKLLNFGGSGLRKIFEICIGVKVEYRGLHNLTKSPCIIASKHQSAYETFTLFNKFYPRAAYVIKAEFGKAFFYLALLYKRYDGIKIKREDGVKALIFMEQQALNILKHDRSVVIFPEGTRMDFGLNKSVFKRGIERIYKKANVPVIPVALNTGAFMPKNSMLFYPGKIIIEFLTPIYPGLDSNEFMEKLQEDINKATKALEQETPCNLFLKNKGLC